MILSQLWPYQSWQMLEKAVIYATSQKVHLIAINQIVIICHQTSQIWKTPKVGHASSILRQLKNKKQNIKIYNLNSKSVTLRSKRVQLNKYETDKFFPQNFQSTTMLIHAFCQICDHKIAFVLICSTGRTISGSLLLQNT